MSLWPRRTAIVPRSPDELIIAVNEEGIASRHAALTAMHATGAKMWDSLYYASLVEAYGRARQVKAGLRVLDDAFVMVNQHDERFCAAELHRVKGELFLNAECGVRNAEFNPEACFLKALSIARSQRAKSWELRAAMSLARLWQSQDKRREAYDLLAPVYEWFTEGFDTADLQEARALLDA
jgi:predicted ATPase